MSSTVRSRSRLTLLAAVGLVLVVALTAMTVLWRDARAVDGPISKGQRHQLLEACGPLGRSCEEGLEDQLTDAIGRRCSEAAGQAIVEAALGGGSREARSAAAHAVGDECWDHVDG